MNCLFKKWKNVLKYFFLFKFLARRPPVPVLRRWRKLLSTMISHLLYYKSRRLFNSTMPDVINMSKQENPRHFDQFSAKNDHATTPSWTVAVHPIITCSVFWLIVVLIFCCCCLVVVIVVTTDVFVVVVVVGLLLLSPPPWFSHGRFDSISLFWRRLLLLLLLFLYSMCSF